MKNLTQELAEALGLPPMTVKAVLTLEVGKLPLLEVDMFVTDNKGNFIKTADPLKLAQVQFMLRLEPYA